MNWHLHENSEEGNVDRVIITITIHKSNDSSFSSEQTELAKKF